MTNYELYFEDCLIGLPKIESESIDFILTDFPYDLSGKNKISKKKGKVIRSFGGWDRLKDKDNFYFQVYRELIRVLKTNATLVAFMDRKDIGYYIRLLERPLTYFNTYYLFKNQPIPHFNKNNFRSGVEEALIMIKGKKPKIFNFLHQSKMKNYFRYNNTIHLTEHPTEKPLGMLKTLIQIFTNEYNTVLDCFLGSGNTLIGCLQLKRKCIGFENDEKYYKAIMKRLEDIRYGLDKWFGNDIQIRN